MPRKIPLDQQFDFVISSEKTLADSTIKTYRRYLNLLAARGFKNRESLLANSKQVVDTITELGDSQIKRNNFYAAVFYSTGRLDFDKEPRGLPLYKGFQENYKQGNHKTNS